MGEKFFDPQTCPNNFWNAFKRITADKIKDANIPPVVDNNTDVSNFPQKANIQLVICSKY